MSEETKSAEEISERIKKAHSMGFISTLAAMKLPSEKIVEMTKAAGIAFSNRGNGLAKVREAILANNN